MRDALMMHDDRLMFSFVTTLQGWIYKNTTNLRDALMTHDRLMFSL